MDTEIELETAADASPIQCTLVDDEAAGQLLEWADLQGRSTAVAAIEGGVRMTLPASLANDVADLARREAGCCAFLTIETSVVDEVLTLDISSANPDALPVIAALAGISLP